MSVAAPRDSVTLRQSLAEAILKTSGPTAVRFPKGDVPGRIPSIRKQGSIDVLLDHDNPVVTLIGYGPMASLALEVGQHLQDGGIAARVIDPVWALPITKELVTMIASSTIVVTIEDGIDAGGLGQKVEIALADAGSQARAIRCAIPVAFIPHGARSEILRGLGFTPERILGRITAALQPG